jgi:general secretion pathway protein M
MKEWFNNLEPRERKIIVGGAVVVLLMSLYFLGWEPFIGKIDKLKKSNVENQRTLAWMQEKAKEIKLLQRNGAAAKKSLGGQSLLGLIDKTAKQNKLGPAIKRVQPEGTTKALVRMESASFNDMVRWLEQLQQRQGVVVVNSTIEKQDAPGLVNARLILEAAG